MIHLGWLLRAAMAPALALAICLVGLAGPFVQAASPSPEPTASSGIIGTGDPRSDGQGPGLVGSPFAILAGVVALGLLAAGGTLLYLRLTRDE